MREAISLLPQHVFMAWCLFKHRDNVTLISSVQPLLQKKPKLTSYRICETMCVIRKQFLWRSLNFTWSVSPSM